MSGTCFDQIAEQIRSILRIVREEGHNLDDLIQAANLRNEREDTDKAENARNVAFTAQVQRLVDRDGPDHAGVSEDTFRGWFAPLREKFQDGDIVVVPERLISVACQVQMIEFNGKVARNLVNSTRLRNADGVTTPDTPYLLRDVEDGKRMCVTSPDDCVKQFAKENRTALTVVEGINLVIQRPEILNDHYIDLSGSRRAGGDDVPSLWVVGGVAELFWAWAGYAGISWGSASSGSVITGS